MKSRVDQRLFALGICLFACLFAASVTRAADLLVVSYTQDEHPQILRFDPTTGASLGVFSTDVVPQEEFVGITGIAYGPHGNVYTASQTGGFGRVSELNSQTGTLVNVTYDDTNAATHLYTAPGRLRLGPDNAFYATSNKLNGPGPLAVDRITADGTISTFVAIGSSGPLREVFDVAFGPDGNLYVAGDANASGQRGAIARYNGTTGAYIDTFIAPLVGLVTAREILFDHSGNLLVGTGSGILRYSGSTGAFMDEFIENGSGGLDAENGMAFGPDGNLYVSSVDNYRILRYNGNTGAFISTFVAPGAGGLFEPGALAFQVPEPATAMVFAPAVLLLRSRRIRQKKGYKYI